MFGRGWAAVTLDAAAGVDAALFREEFDAGPPTHFFRTITVSCEQPFAPGGREGHRHQSGSGWV